MRAWLSNFICLLTGVFCLAFTQYQPLKDKTFSEFTGNTHIDEYYIKYTIYNGNVGFDNNWVAQNLTSNSYRILSYIRTNYPDIRMDDCRFMDDLEIFTVEMQTLNDKARFNKYTHNGEIWALFDIRPDERRKSSIVLTNHPYFNGSLFKHELAHYWYYRLCMDYSTDVDTEDFAIELENF